jgi:hypothetical protein
MTMNDMIAFCTAILNSVVTFVSTPPVFWLFSLICFSVIVGIVLKLINHH